MATSQTETEVQPDDSTTPTSEKPVGNYQPDKDAEAVIAKWKGRMERAKRFRKPVEDKWLRMYYLYRALRRRQNYAYNTNLMPAIGFEIIETIKPRLASSKMTTRIFPTKREDIGNPALEAWDSLTNYNFEAMDLEDKKIDWIQAMLNFGNGYFAMHWNGREQRPDGDVWDNWLLWIDPNAGPRLRDSAWEIKQIFKKKARIEDDEKARGANNLYDNVAYLEDTAISEDPRRDRYAVDTLKMGQIGTGDRKAASENGNRQSEQVDEKSQEKMVELWECYDHETGDIVTIGNKTVLMRNEESPYINVNGGRLIIDLPCIKIPWSAYAMSVLEPVETTIHEIADSRNQAMDDIVFSLDPVRKIRKDSGITADDIKYAPGAVWELKKADDVVVERGPEISKAWIDKDTLLRNEIQSNLALSEYTRGIPQNSTEPMGKVELLLMQSNIRFSQFVRQLKIALTDMANICIEMNREFLTEDKAYRILGETVDFKDFKDEDRDVKVDADVELEVVQERTADEEKSETLELYKIFVVDDKPDPQDAEGVKLWQARKRIFQKMILEDYNRGEYSKALLATVKLPDEAKAAVEPAPNEAGAAPAGDQGPNGPIPPEVAAALAGGQNGPAAPTIPQPLEMMAPDSIQPLVPSDQTIPGAAVRPGLLKRLAGRFAQLLPKQ